MPLTFYVVLAMFVVMLPLSAGLSLRSQERLGRRPLAAWLVTLGLLLVLTFSNWSYPN